MHRAFKWFVVSLLLVGCNAGSSRQQPTDRHQLTQVSIINALMLGQYDGVMTMQELLRYGNFGLGTIDHLDGELIVLDGKAYQGKADGTVAEIAGYKQFPLPSSRHSTMPARCRARIPATSMTSKLNWTNCFPITICSSPFESMPISNRSPSEVSHVKIRRTHLWLT